MMNESDFLKHMVKMAEENTIVSLDIEYLKNNYPNIYKLCLYGDGEEWNLKKTCVSLVPFRDKAYIIDTAKKEGDNFLRKLWKKVMIKKVFNL